jgi:hypothetical protein
MWVFNRIIVILLLAGLFALGLSAVVHSLNVGDYRLAELPTALGLEGIYQGIEGYVRNIEEGRLIPIDFVVLGGIAIVGLVLLILELKPPRPRRVRMQQGTYTTRSAVENEATAAVEQDPQVLQSSVNVKAQRRPGAKVDVRASVRTGEDVQSIRSEVQDRVQQRLDESGIPVGKLKVRLNESDPRQTKTRVN